MKAPPTVGYRGVIPPDKNPVPANSKKFPFLSMCNLKKYNLGKCFKSEDTIGSI